MRLVTIPYRPRSQFEAYHDRTERFAKVVAHRRFGKTVGCINDMVRKAATATCVGREAAPPRFSYIAPTYGQAKDTVWSYLKFYSAPIPGLKISESELTVVYPNSARIRLYGADNYDRLRGGYNDGVILDEFGDFDPRAWPEVVLPTLSDYQGWATVIGTPKGRNQFYSIDRDGNGQELPDWFRLTLKSSQTGILKQEELWLAQTQMSDEQFAQEYECSFDAAIVGAYYGRLMTQAESDNRIAGVPYEPSAPVYTAWDLGIRDTLSIWFAQVVGREIHLIDYYENTGAGLDHYVAHLRSKPYFYADHIVPHDAQARELGTGKTRLEVMQSLGLTNLTVATQHRVEDGINGARTIIPRCWFDAKKCHRGIEALKMYRADWDDKLGALKPTPVHDWASHAADAFRYLAMTLDSKIVNTGFHRPIHYPRRSVA